MNLLRAFGRPVALPLLVVAILISGSGRALAQAQRTPSLPANTESQPQSQAPQSQGSTQGSLPFDRPAIVTQSPAAALDIQPIIDRAEAIYKRGDEARAKGQLEQARILFDQALDVVMLSGVTLRSNAKLDAYYRDLLERIQKREARVEQANTPARSEVAEPSVLDELSEIKESELAAVSPEGIKIFGRYDLQFSVAPPVYQFINFFVTGPGRSTMETGLQRSGRYRQMVERVFKEERVPLDLIWLAQAESVWKPAALSRAAAKGIWQFIPATGTRFGLAQTAWVDQRSSPESSTRAAARYLRWLHEHFAGDWMLAMAAYNSGENRVDSAVAKCGYADFWELHRRGLLPLETRNYVPIILSIIIVSKNQKRYGFNVKPDLPVNFDTFDVPSQTDLKVAADLIGVPYEVLQELNPELRRGASPPGQRYPIRIPKGMKKQFEIAYVNLPEDQRVRKVVVPRDEVAEDRGPYRVQVASYQVRRGDTLAALARKTGVSVKELARLNRMSARGELRKGQTVKLPKSATDRNRRARAGKGHLREEPVVRSRSTGRQTDKSTISRAGDRRR
jgi:peptidoglycan lytic transglycosylase D